MGKKNKGNKWSDDDKSRNDRQAVASKEELSEYIHACRPGVIVVIFALLLMLIAVLVWGFVGTLPVTETVTGAVIDTSQYARLNTPEAESFYEKLQNVISEDDGQILVFCFLDASRFNGQAIKQFHDEAFLKMPDQKTFKGEIALRYKVPISKEKAKKILFNNEWALEKCVGPDYTWLLIIRPCEDVTNYAITLSEVTFVTEEVRPIRFLMK